MTEPAYRDGYEELWKVIRWLQAPERTMDQALRVYAKLVGDPTFVDAYWAELARWDRFFLGVVLCRRDDLKHPWIFARCREVERNPDGYLDLWARGHYKSTLITYLGAIQEILRDRNITIGIFSHTRPIAKGFLRQIKREFETNEALKRLFPDICYENPKKQSPLWNEDEGIIVKRSTNAKEATVEAWGLVDSQPTGKHFKLMIYDDVVTERSVNTPEMILKTTTAWELSRNLAGEAALSVVPCDASEEAGPCEVKSEQPRTWYIGTRYNYADTYAVMIARGAAIPRIHPATADGTPNGEPVFLSFKEWERKKAESSDYVIACQMLLNPVAGTQQEFKPDWIRYYEIRPEVLNVAILVDPANSKKRGSCNTAIAVIGMDAQMNKYFLDGCCHKMSLEERYRTLSKLYWKWSKAKGVRSVTVGYEKYGMQCDIDHFEIMMRLEKKTFPIIPVSWVRDSSGASNRKDDRIRRLIPDHKNWRFFYPYEGEPTKLQILTEQKGKGYLVSKPIMSINENGRSYNVVEYLLKNEYFFFPATTQKDLLDAMSRVYDIDLQPPMPELNEKDMIPDAIGDP